MNIETPLAGERLMANAVRALAMDAVEAAKSGHPGIRACRWAWRTWRRCWSTGS